MVIVLTERREVVEVANVHRRNRGEMAKEGVGGTRLPQMFDVVLKDMFAVRKASLSEDNAEAYWRDVQ